MELSDVLERVGAPAPLVIGVRERVLDLEQAWSECRRGEHRVWLAAVGGAPVEVIVECAAAVVLSVCERLGRSLERIAETAERAVSGDTEGLEEAIDACEALAQADPTTYREPAAAGLAQAARAGALVGHAALALAEGEARREAPRLERARRMAALLGAGADTTLPARAGPARLEPLSEPDPAQASFAFAVAAAADAVEASEAALRATTDPDAADWARAEVDALVRAALEEDEGEPS
jgi:hypothetical protein